VDGAWQVRFPDVPEALTEGDTEAEAHALATDVLLAALGGLVKRNSSRIAVRSVIGGWVWSQSDTAFAARSAPP
jgi:hypothetical protein